MPIRRRAGPPAGFGGDDSGSSSDEGDAFSALGRKKKKKLKTKASLSGGDDDDADSKKSRTTASEGDDKDGDDDNKNSQAGKSADTSSNKRHHHVNAARAARMEALLQELQAEPTTPSANRLPSAGVPGQYGPAAHDNRPPPDKMGSYVPPGEEHLTTNVFVGNLAPQVTEEELTDAFRQFGDLYSVKIMWPRTPEERARNRNTGFVCFMNRNDAQEAMDAFQDADPLDVGRRLVLRWGKNVKKTVKFGTGGVPTNLRKRKRDADVGAGAKDDAAVGDGGFGGGEPSPGDKRNGDAASATNDKQSSASTAAGEARNAPESAVPREDTTTSPTAAVRPKREPVDLRLPPKYDPALHGTSAIRVVSPSDPYRLKFITTVASFVAKDGSILERKLVEKESSNPDFAFLHEDKPGIGGVIGNPNDETCAEERIFYRWRVYAFAQGDGFDSWRTEPFVMIEPHGRYWIPPQIDAEAARKEEEAEQKREEEILAAQEERRRIAEKKDFMTGRQLEHAKFGAAGKGRGAEAAEGGAHLTEYERERFDDLLRVKLCASRDAICELMAFCFDKSGAAKQIAGLLKESLLEDAPAVSVDTRIARLYLLSDVLFNSQQPGVRNAFRYRDAIEQMAPEIFVSLGRHGKGKAGRMTMNKLRKAVGGVLSAWTNWSVYNAVFMDELQARFEGKELPSASESEDAVQSRNDEEEVPPSESALEGDEMSGQNVPAPPSAPKGSWQDVDGEPLNDDLDGEPLNEPIPDDVDGEALDDADDIDGEQLEEGDVDGEPMSDEDC